MVVEGDTLRTIVRNLSAAELMMDQSATSGYGGVSILLGPVEEFQPTCSAVSFALGSGADRVAVDVTIALLHFAERGTVRVTAQAILREAPAADSNVQPSALDVVRRLQ